MWNQKSAKIVNINTVEKKLGIPFMSADVKAKFAVEGLTESLLYGVEPFGIKWIKRAGVIKTNMEIQLVSLVNWLIPIFRIIMILRTLWINLEELLKKA